MKHSSKQAIAFSHAKKNEKMSYVQDNGIQYTSKISNLFSLPLFIVSCENSEAVQNGHGDSLLLSENSEFPVR